MLARRCSLVNAYSLGGRGRQAPGRRRRGGQAGRRLRMISAMQPVPAPTPPRQRAALVNSRSRETRQALIRAALRLWGEGDFDAAYEASTVADIARAAGVSKGTFYFHFASKEDILLEM